MPGASVIKPSLLIAIVAGMVAYSFIAKVLVFHLLALRVPGASRLNHRLGECMLLWVVACSAAGWTLYFRKQRPTSRSSIWPLVVIPLVPALWLAATEALDAYQGYVATSNTPIVAMPLWIEVWPLVCVALPLAFWAVISFALVAQAKVWRLSASLLPCPKCDYDLTGNVSGICPECGTLIPQDIKEKTATPPHRS